ncbi:LysR family transcriptional regulator [Dactylosporangium aurantiacum]|uniref:LysR family transcriptional regulator n=1 Tax=Dactylosporangium aurantiacum TaxID=35754 RepID=A0A9Q9MNU0_9ACTN|nr:LysR family transcriptional regulator [Dactylosporangium aurantiacum]
MNNDRLLLLAELARLGSMREVAEELGTTTSTVSQQLAVLAKEAGTALIEPDGRRVRLTPAGRRLAGHAVTILAAVEAARLDLDPSAEPAGTVRVAGFATAIRRSLLPIVAALPARHERLRVQIHEHEPAEALQLLAADEVDLALTYDYNLAPSGFPDTVEASPLWSARWSLGVPAGAGVDGDALAVFRAFRDASWLVNSRNTADEDVVRTVASMAGYTPRIAHRADSLELLQDLIVAGLGVGLLPADQPTAAGVALAPLRRPDVRLRAFAVTRRGRRAWPPLAVVLDLLTGPAPQRLVRNAPA